MRNMNVTLAERDGLGCVRVCECGCLTLTLGVVTLHLDSETFLRTAVLLQQAAERYSERDKSVAAASRLSEAHGLSSGRFTN